MKKLAVTLITSLLATVAFAQAPAPDAAGLAPQGGAPKAGHHKKQTKKQAKKPFVLDKTKLGEGHLQ